MHLYARCRLELLPAAAPSRRQALQRWRARSGKGPAPPHQPTSLLDWLVEQQGAEPRQLRVERAFFGDGRGWGLAATHDIAAEEVILSVPLPVAITSEVTIV
jgi:hypothetical protein